MKNPECSPFLDPAEERGKKKERKAFVLLEDVSTSTEGKREKERSVHRIGRKEGRNLFLLGLTSPASRSSRGKRR